VNQIVPKVVHIQHLALHIHDQSARFLFRKPKKRQLREYPNPIVHTPYLAEQNCDVSKVIWGGTSQVVDDHR
jgi:hypothetical protein